MVGILLGPGQAMPSPEEQARIIAAGNRIIEEYRTQETTPKARGYRKSLRAAHTCP
ncbi:hypothetical protein [Microcoleus phage My-WqHQDG]|nr:hypothetical protein [Microcoleus phage My-WqHQDG]